MVETSYALYLIIALAITVWVARTLSKNGIVFLVQCFGQNEELARSTNHLLVVGFYLVDSDDEAGLRSACERFASRGEHIEFRRLAE